MPPFALQKATFCTLKGKLSERERQHAAKALTVSKL